MVASYICFDVYSGFLPTRRPRPFLIAVAAWASRASTSSAHPNDPPCPIEFTIGLILDPYGFTRFCAAAFAFAVEGDCFMARAWASSGELALTSTVAPGTL